jgi:hypothetical protein
VKGSHTEFVRAWTARVSLLCLSFDEVRAGALQTLRRDRGRGGEWGKVEGVGRGRVELFCCELLLRLYLCGPCIQSYTTRRASHDETAIDLTP